MFTDMRDKHPVAMKQVLRDQPIGRLGRSDEIAAEMFWLCSPGAGVVLGLGRVYIELCGEVGFVLTDTVWSRRLVSGQRSHRAVGAAPQVQGSASWSPGRRRETHDGYHSSRRVERRRVGGLAASGPLGREQGRQARARPSAEDQWQLVEAAHRGALVRSAGPVGALVDGGLSLPPPAARRGPGPALCRRAAGGGSGRPCRLDRAVRRQYGRPGPPARSGGQKRALRLWRLGAAKVGSAPKST